MDSIINGDSRDPAIYPPGPYHLTITSPPYFVGKKYEEDYSYEEYIQMLKDVLTNTAERTIDGGKIAINIADIAAFSKVSGEVEESIEISRIIADHMRSQDCKLLSRIIWHKDDPWVNSQHVGYHDGIPATYTRVLPNWEYIWVYYKGTPKRENVPPVTETISKQDWKRWVSAVWYMRSVRANDDHAAKFPEELVRRLTLLYSIQGDTVFDPFMGSGTTAVVAWQNGRNYAGIERDPEYYELIKKSLAAVENCLERQFIAAPRFEQNKIF